MLTLHCEIKETKQIQSINDLQQDHLKQFDHIGHFPGIYHIVLNPTITPVRAFSWCMYIYLKDQIEKRIKQNGEKLGHKESQRTDLTGSAALLMTRKAVNK